MAGRRRADGLVANPDDLRALDAARRSRRHLDAVAAELLREIHGALGACEQGIDRLADPVLRDADRDGCALAVRERGFRDTETKRFGECFALMNTARPRDHEQRAAVVAAEGVFGAMPGRLLE